MERWLYFFKQAEHQDLDNLPDIMKTKEMIQAMETLQDFSENQKNYLLYQSRIDAQLEQNTWKAMMAEKEQEIIAKQKKLEEALAEKEKALKEKEIYLKILKEKGISVYDLSLDKT